MFQSLSSPAESSSSETRARSHPGRSGLTRASDAVRERTIDDLAIQRATAGTVVDPAETKRDHNSPGPCARPGDPLREAASCCRSSGSTRDSRGDKARGARLKV